MTPEQKIKGKDPRQEFFKAFELLTELRKHYLYKEPRDEKFINKLWVRVCEFLGADEDVKAELKCSLTPCSLSLSGAGTGRKAPVAPDYDRKKVKDDVINFDTNKDYFD